MKAMIFAAGLGTRLQQLTSQRPKALVEVNGQPLLGHVLLKLKREGFTEIVINVHHFADQIINYLNEADITTELNILVSDEHDFLLDTGGGLRKAFPLFGENNSEPILIHNVDILSNVDLPSLYNKCKGHDAILLVSQRTTKRYLLFDGNMKMVGWTNIETGEVKSPYEHLNLSDCQKLAFAGIHVVSPKLEKAMQKWPAKFSIMDFYIQECSNLDFVGVCQPHLELLDVGKPESLKQASAFLEKIK